MTDLEVYRQPTADVALTSDIDSWARVAGDVIKLANQIYDTPFVPDGLRGSAPAVAAAILTGRELGIGPMTALQHIHVIHNKPGLSALLMRSLIQGQGHEWQDVKVTDTEVSLKARRRGETEWTTASFTAEQARRAGIDLGKYPQDKLYARATSRLARRKFADVIAGMPYSAEELEDDPGDTPATEAKPTGRVTAAEITGRTAPQTASPATPAPRAPEPPHTPPAGQVAGEALSSGPAPSGQPAGNEPAAGPDEPDERDYDSSGTVNELQLKAIWTALNRNFGFGSDEKDQARAVCAHIVSHPLASSKDLSKNEARIVLDTLASWREVAERHEESPRDFLIQLLATGEVPGE
jgi:hypothetical protein